MRQIVPFDQAMVINDNHSSAMSVNNNTDAMTFRINAVESKDGLSHAVIIIPPSSSDLSEAPSTLSLLSLNVDCTITTKIDETVQEITIVPSASMDTAESDNENKPPAQQIERPNPNLANDNSKIAGDLDTFDRIRIASAGMEFQRKHNPRLRTCPRHSFGHTIDNVQIFRGGNKKPCPRGGWLTRMSKGGKGCMNMGETGTPANGVYRTTNGFTFQC